MVYKILVSNLWYLHYFFSHWYSFHISALGIVKCGDLYNVMLPLKLASCSIVIVGLGTRPIACRDSAGPATCLSDLMPAWQLVVVRLVS